MYIPYNINEYVRVELTDVGVTHYRQSVAALLAHFPEELREHKLQKICGLNGKTLQIQLWELMNIFGPKMYMSADSVFEHGQIHLNMGAD